MSDLNKEYIENCLRGICQDCIHFQKTKPVILKMLKSAYKSGLVQAEIDNTMGVIEENSTLKQENDKLKEIIKKIKKEVYKNQFEFTFYGCWLNIKDILESEEL